MSSELKRKQSQFPITTGSPTFFFLFYKGPQPLLSARLRASRVKTIRGTRNRLNCVMFCGIYRVIQDESSILWEVTVIGHREKKMHMNICHPEWLARYSCMNL